MIYSKFIVGKGNSEYSTVQLAIDAVYEDGGGVVYVKPGTYTEDLVLKDGVDVCGAIGISDSEKCVIFGKHLPPLQGSVTFKNICLQTATSVFSSYDEGTSSLFLISCFVCVEDGYIFDLPYWKPPAAFVIFDLGDSSNQQNGVVYNLSGAKIKFIAATIGAGSERHMTISGNAEFFTVEFICPIILERDSNALFASGCLFKKTIVANDESCFKVFNSVFLTGNKAAIVYNTRNNSIVSQTSINSTADHVIEGFGPGLINLCGIAFSDNNKINNKLEKKSGDFIVGNLVIQERGKGIKISEGENAKMGVAKLINGSSSIDTIVVNENSRIFLTAQSKVFGSLFIKKIISGQGFIICSTNAADACDVAWLVIDSA